MARTNKMWILKKKMQLQKQKAFKTEKKTAFVWKKQFVNPKWNTYERFFRSWKWINDKTGCREDPDGYRILRQANSWEISWQFKWQESWCWRKWVKKSKRLL